MARLRPGQKRRVPLHKTYAKGLKSLGKKALKATPPGMMLTAAQKLKEEFGRLTKPKKRPEAKTGPVKRSVKQKKEMEAKKNLERLRTIKRTVKKRRPSLKKRKM